MWLITIQRHITLVDEIVVSFLQQMYAYLTTDVSALIIFYDALGVTVLKCSIIRCVHEIKHARCHSL